MFDKLFDYYLEFTSLKGLGVMSCHEFLRKES